MSLTSNGLFNPMNRFGFHKDTLLSYSPDYKDKTKVDCYVPSRADVFRMPIDELKPILIKWFTKAPDILTPSDQQKESVLELMKKRRDADNIASEISDISSL
ncbi:MAG: hypothetical protein MI867_00490 [Pseudomonadales bacterium]|nr:hypothetical protein [Pseudomonadales bacterium]